MPHLVEVLLPVTEHSVSRINLVRDELRAKFGGLTIYINSPADGLWEEDGEVERDRIVVAEVMTDELERRWWATYRKRLEARFEQEEIVIRCSVIERL